MEYDAAGNRTSVTDANGNMIRYTYDENNLLTGVAYPDGKTVTYKYDTAGRQIAMVDGRGSTTYWYDSLNRLISVDGPAEGDTVNYSYDAAGNRVKMIDQDGGVTTYEYDSLNRLIKLTDPAGKVTSYQYDELSNLISAAYHNNTRTNYTFDNLNRLLKLVNEKSNSQEVLTSYSYEYDSAGMRTGVSNNGDYTKYTYDPLNRLKSETMYKGGPTGKVFYSSSYNYDAVGNRVSMSRIQAKPSSTGKADSWEHPGEYNYTYTYDRENRLRAVNITKVSGNQSSGSTITSSQIKDGEILVKFKEGVLSDTIDSINLKYGVTKIKKLPRLDVYRLKIPSGKTVDEMLTLYRQEVAVQNAEPNIQVKALVISNDASFSKQWGLQNTGQSGGTEGADVKAPEAWDVEKGSTSTIIAVIDTGCDLDHPDLTGKFVPGYDFVNNDSTPDDDNGHGTFCAGVAAANTDNMEGMAGVSWNSKIMPIKVLDAGGSGNFFDVADGIIYAADNGAQVINLSLGADSGNSTLEDAMRYAYEKGVVIVCAAGNDGAAGVSYPGAYTQYCITVAATDHNDQRAAFSNYGPEVDVAAPGVSIYSTYKDGSYLTASGTSASTPFVSGLAALLLSHDSTLTPGQVEWQIQATSDDVNVTTNPGADNYIGAGRINAARALGAGSTSNVSADGTITYDYDKNGNLVKQIVNRNNRSFRTQYNYDYENRMTGIIYPDSSTSAYRYDGGGRRVQSVEEGVYTNFLYDGLDVIIEKDGSNTTQSYYTRGLNYGGGIGGIIAAYRNGTSQYYQYDGIGNVIGLTDPTGSLLQTYNYDAFGNLLSSKGQGKGAKYVVNPYGFSTKETNLKSGLIYFGARYYDPFTGRFVSKDPWPGTINDPQTFINKYTYVNNNPVNWIDPYGLCTGKDTRSGGILPDAIGLRWAQSASAGGGVASSQDILISRKGINVYGSVEGNAGWQAGGDLAGQLVLAWGTPEGIAGKYTSLNFTVVPLGVGIDIQYSWSSTSKVFAIGPALGEQLQFSVGKGETFH